MKRIDRDQARRITTYVDDVVLRRRDEDSDAGAMSAEDREFVRLRELAHCLSEIDVVPPAGFQAQLAERVRASGGEASLPWHERIRAWRPTLPRVPSAHAPRHALRTAMLMAGVVAGVLVLGRSVIDVPVVSAQAVLVRSDAALTGLVRPGQVLYRQWKVTASGAPGGLTGAGQSGRMIEEWMDGADFDRVAARWYSADGKLQIAYTTLLQDGQYRPYVYFSPGVYDERRGVLNVEPTRREFEAALAGFPESARRALRVYLDRHYIYAPITGERSFNRAMVEEHAERVPEMPRILVSFDHSHMLNSTPVYRVRLLDSASVTFNWRSSGPPLIRLAQAEIVRYIARDSFLSVRTEERYVFEGGRRRFTVRELMATRALDRAQLTVDPFAVDVPPGTPVQRQSAVEQLSGVADVLKRVPAFTSRLQREPGASSPVAH